MSLLLSLFLTFLKIVLLSIGGGYAIISLIQEELVYLNGWLSLQEFTDIITISQMTPGPLALNTASFVGIRISGLQGAVIATIGCVLGGFIISILLYNFFKKNKSNQYVAHILKGLLTSSVGLIASSASMILLLALFNSQTLDISTLQINISAFIIFILSLFVLRKYKVNPIIIILITGILGLFTA